jgi:NADPH:quinone reductase-like Zn-dependent oxidoreductase
MASWTPSIGSARSTSSSTPWAAAPSRALPHCSERTDGSSRSPRSRRARGRTSSWNPTDQLIELGRLIDATRLRVAIDSTFGLSQGRAAFERSLAAGKRGKVVIDVGKDSAPDA